MKLLGIDVSELQARIIILIERYEPLDKQLSIIAGKTNIHKASLFVALLSILLIVFYVLVGVDFVV